MFSAWSVVRKDTPKMRKREREKGQGERERATASLECRACIYAHPHDLMHTVIRYTEGLGSLSLLSSSRSVSARRHLFFPRSNNSWGQPFWELAAARSYCSIVTLNARLRSWSRRSNILLAYFIPRSVFIFYFITFLILFFAIFFLLNAQKQSVSLIAKSKMWTMKRNIADTFLALTCLFSLIFFFF